MNIDNVKTESVHISNISAGDIIIRNGLVTTVSGNNIKRNTFMGTTLFGDSYRLGHTPVEKVVAWKTEIGFVPIRK